jgi:hypothetical protein
MPKAAIFDLDGTLLDSVDLHAIAWQEAMLQFGHDVSFERARSQIGKGGDKLIPVFLSTVEQLNHGKELEEWRGNLFKKKYLPLVRPFSAVPNLLRCVRDAGLQIAIASSAKKDELDKYLDIAGIKGRLNGIFCHWTGSDRGSGWDSVRWKVLLPVIVLLPLLTIIFSVSRGLTPRDIAIVVIVAEAVLQGGYFLGLLIRLITTAGLRLARASSFFKD